MRYTGGHERYDTVQHLPTSSCLVRSTTPSEIPNCNSAAPCGGLTPMRIGLIIIHHCEFYFYI